MKKISILSVFCFIALLCCISCGSEQTKETEDQQTISLEEIKAAQPEKMDQQIEEESTANEAANTEDTEVSDEELTEKSATTVKDEKDAIVEKAVVKKKEAPKRKRKKGIMKFSEKTWPFGTIMEGEKVEHKFFFTNVGNAPINVKEASATCGCTYPSHPFVPIKPGEKSYIGVTFNSKGKEGKQRPKVTVITDSDLGTFNLYLDGKVENKPKETTPENEEEKVEEKKEN